MDIKILPLVGTESSVNSYYRQSWRPTLISTMRTQARGVHEGGLLGFALSETQYTAATGIASPFRPRKNPPERPPANSSAATIQFYREDREAYYAQQDTLHRFLVALWNSLGEAPKSLIVDQRTGELISNLKEILRILDSRFLNISRQELKSARESMNVSFSRGENYDNFIAVHRKAHATFLSARQILPEYIKIESLYLAVAHERGMATATERYFALTPDVQDQTFEGLVNIINQHVANSTVQSESIQYANIVRPSSEDALLEAMKSITAGMADLKRNQAQSIQSRPPRRYCWTHGSCTHHSNQCLSKATGHKDDATWKRKLGGKE
jgi:hypothetical protein